MPAASVTYRPHRLRITGLLITVALVAATVIGWLALPVSLRSQFTWSQRLTLLVVLGFLLGVVWALASSYVRADQDGLRIRNGIRTHHVGWDRVHKILLRPGDPWALLLIRPTDRPFEIDLDAEKRHLMGIQASDRRFAADAVDDLRRRQGAARRARNPQS